MSYKLSQNIDKEVAFLVSWSELDGRLDAEFYQNHFMQLKRELHENGAEKLGSIASFSNESWDQKEYFEDTFPYIEISEIDTNSGSINKVKEVKKDEAPSRAKKIVRLNDILISTTRPHRGAISFFEKTKDVHIASTGFAIIRNINNDSISKRFLFLMLRQKFCLMQMKQRSSGGNYPAITEEELRKILIPVPSKKIQQNVIKVFDEALKVKERKVSKAHKLLQSIDEYLLSELGIEVPEKDNSIDSRIFKTNFQELTGKRLDPIPYDTHSVNLKRAIEDSNYPKFKLKECITKSISGEWGISIDSNVSAEKYQKCLVIRATEFDNLYNLKLDNSRVKYRHIKKSKLKKLDIQTNDLLIEKSGGSPDQPVGRIAILRKELVDNNSLCYSNFVHKIRIDSSKIMAEYLFNYLKTIHNIKLTEIMQSQTSGIRNLIMSEYFNQSIVIPDKEIQKRISDEINKRRSEAKILEKEATKELKNTKKEIEEIILRN